jgi:hypothetical protein
MQCAMQWCDGDLDCLRPDRLKLVPDPCRTSFVYEFNRIKESGHPCDNGSSINFVTGDLDCFTFSKSEPWLDRLTSEAVTPIVMPILFSDEFSAPKNNALEKKASSDSSSRSIYVDDSTGLQSCSLMHAAPRKRLKSSPASPAFIDTTPHAQSLRPAYEVSPKDKLTITSHPDPPKCINWTGNTKLVKSSEGLRIGLVGSNTSERGKNSFTAIRRARGINDLSEQKKYESSPACKV